MCYEKSMKLVGWVVGVLLVVCVALAATGYFLYPKLPFFLSRSLSEKFKVPVRVGNVNMTYDLIHIDGLEIANPPQSQMQTAFVADVIDIKAPLPHYLKKDIIIEEISINNIYTSIEFYNRKNTTGNWSVLIDNLDSNESFGGSERQGSNNVDKAGRTVHINKLILTNISVDLMLYGKKRIRLPPISRIEFDDVDSEKGLPTEEITEIIVQKMMGRIFSIHGITNMLMSVVEAPFEAAGGLFKGIFGL